jgi:hypothetical protein
MTDTGRSKEVKGNLREIHVNSGRQARSEKDTERFARDTERSGTRDQSKIQERHWEMKRGLENIKRDSLSSLQVDPGR